MDSFATTPFGGGRMSASKFRQRAHVAQRRDEVSDGGNDTGRAEKWQLIRALTEARDAYGLSDRAITVLEALLSFHPARELDGSAPIIVFPSNAELSLRSRGMADATLRRHLAALVEAGLILRRDSPNGKRYCLRGDAGEIESAFGFDLSPLALEAAAIHAAAEQARAEARACQRLRGEITIHLRDAVKIVEAGLAEKRRGDWQGHMLALVPLSRRLARQAPRAVLERRLDDVTRLRARIETDYLNSLSFEEMSGNDVDSERHYQNSNTDHQFEQGTENTKKPAADAGGAERLTAGNPDSQSTMAGPRAPEVKSAPVTLAYLLQVCPALETYAKAGIADWRDVVTTADLVRAMLGISPDAWRRASDAMGQIGAAISVAAILERADRIKSPGGYLRALTERAETGRFSVKPMLAALER